MTQSELELAVAEVTGEDVLDIVRRGFSLVESLCYEALTREHDVCPRLIDWDSQLAGATMTFDDLE